MQERKRPMPVGIEDFKKLIQREYYFVDKTRFIRELMDFQTEVTLITRPRRFGKTLTLSMLRYFFDMENAEENRELFCGLDIERAGEKYMREQGTRPVVFLTLKEVQRPTYVSMLSMLSSVLQETYACHRHLLASEAMDEEQKGYIRRILEGNGTEEELMVSLKRLMVYLEQYHGKNPLLLLDEYDAPILSAWENGYYKEGIDFMRGFLGSALKTNPALGFAVLTGVTRVSKESIFSGLNNLKVCSVLSDAYCDIFGFTQEEAARLMEECGVGDKLQELKKWYDGYRFGQVEIYNPWSVIRYIDEGCKCQPYWMNTSGNSILKDLLRRVDTRRHRELQGLVQGKTVESPVLENIVYADIHRNRDALFMMLMTTGYLKPVETWKDEDCADWVRLKIPNLEIRMAYRKEILGHIVPSQGETLLRDMLRSMTDGDAEGFQENLSDLLRDFVSYHDTAQPESFYHGLLLGLSVLLDGEYRVASNRESGYGRFDIAFFPLKDGAPGVVLELKSARSEEAMEGAAKEALRQIEEKAYLTEFARQEVKEIWKYGIAFHGKRVWMECQ
ncbi:MAG: AAA family ATPase [Selenomonadaceae bacterium]|nr:AAA family ATPase [Selenomonadaceae bacterium]